MAFSDIFTHSLPAAGMLAFGPAGAGAGTILAGAIGQGQADKAQGAADSARSSIPLYDPMQLGFKSDVERKERAFNAGTDPFTSNATRQAVNATAQTQSNVLRAGGPDVVQNLLRAESAGQQSIGKYAAIGAEHGIDLLNMKGRLIDNMSNRAWQTQRERADDLATKAAVMRQDSNNNMLAGVPFIPQLDFTKTGGRAPLAPFRSGGGAGGSWADKAYGTNTESSLGSGYRLGDLTQQPPQINFGLNY